MNTITVFQHLTAVWVAFEFGFLALAFAVLAVVAYWKR